MSRETSLEDLESESIENQEEVEEENFVLGNLNILGGIPTALTTPTPVRNRIERDFEEAEGTLN